MERDKLKSMTKLEKVTTENILFIKSNKNGD